MDITTQLISNCESLNQGEKSIKVNGGLSAKISRLKGRAFGGVCACEVYVLTKSRSI